MAPERAQRHRKIIWFNALLTVGLMTAVVLEAWPLPVLFATAFAIAVLVNYTCWSAG
ncbi:hypothetical protein GCM10022222_18230 [Amycolatopsis ultiminotia]|uniref:Uncharacterized protein n=1 Tax=Amycolatopsis ultiminotia TaxID=543629 RepID=A0ABP6VJI9_9PSEU